MTTLIGPKWAHKQLTFIYTEDFEGSRGPRGRQSREKHSEPRGLGGGRGRVNLPPRRLVWRFWEVWRVGCRWVPLHAMRPEASADFKVWCKKLYKNHINPGIPRIPAELSQNPPRPCASGRVRTLEELQNQSNPPPVPGERDLSPPQPLPAPLYKR